MSQCYLLSAKVVDFCLKGSKYVQKQKQLSQQNLLNLTSVLASTLTCFGRALVFEITVT